MFEEVIKNLLNKVASFFLFLPILNSSNEPFKFDNVYQLEKGNPSVFMLMFLLFKFQLIKLQVIKYERKSSAS